MDENEKLALALFDAFGLRAEKIPECDEKSPDFLVTLEDRRLLFELKTKFDSDQVLGKRDTKLDSGEIHEHFSKLDRTNLLSAIVRKAREQLETQKQKLNADECYVFLLSSGPYAHDKYDQFINTIYGRNLIVPMGNNAPEPKYFYYYGYNDFFRHREILDGALVCDGRRATLCLNTFSANYEKIRSSGFGDKLTSGILDPLTLEENGQAYVLDSDIDRKKTESIDKYLIKKYSLEKITATNFPSFTYETKTKL